MVTAISYYKNAFELLLISCFHNCIGLRVSYLMQLFVFGLICFLFYRLFSILNNCIDKNVTKNVYTMTTLTLLKRFVRIIDNYVMIIFIHKET